ncbi:MULTISPECIES: hypothetical protein [unclassified Vibrio]|uniref:hypothetical protein n=1 Tax=unclassified Vibrio TaxID=2614977 RepID=UPI000B8E5104|nr:MULTISPECIES: hypothetical protein [unclassified Vibrio]NAW98625.1 hypothetical protein [Vibrio sp. V23_P3S9T160]OXX23608.1 hypothetical protein B9J88_07560 [Vibrio sp. V05_P4A8T149]OXX29937.1 hypothetical protein B9J81_17020 [Vibrio sp. V04_P4A5T148]OXX32434.1 hypothetical protein B9J95_07225 [Vibrio sp. V14_P6S14T42]OXX49378.1 hypothetical protein B9J85_00765 [Vibrio sp. V11_P1A41T118]
MARILNQEIRLEVIVRFGPNNQNGIGEFFISDCRAEAITQVDSASAVTAFGARDIAYSAVNQFLKQQNELIKAEHFVKTGAPL